MKWKKDLLKPLLSEKYLQAERDRLVYVKKDSPRYSLAKKELLKLNRRWNREAPIRGARELLRKNGVILVWDHPTPDKPKIKAIRNGRWVEINLDEAWEILQRLSL